MLAEPIDGYCVCCQQLRPGLPPPSDGSCAYCYNHLMIVSYPEIKEAYARYNAGEAPSFSTGICGSETAGYGVLDPNGYWEFPLYVNQEPLKIIDMEVL